jgi:hypothetical protein
MHAEFSTQRFAEVSKDSYFFFMMTLGLEEWII